MAGIYLHIPFCKTRCIYCDFYSSTGSAKQERYVRALCRELEERLPYLNGEPVYTIYIGGGTPSQLKEAEFRLIFETLDRVCGLQQAGEITLEANPDDLTEEYVAMLRTLPFNRISIGIQTFNDEMLQLLGRRHTARQAIEAVERCRRKGFNNLSIDLMYGLPGETDRQWNADLQQALSLNAEHLSAYHLTYEKDTPLYRMTHLPRVDEESSVRFFTTLIDTLAAGGYEHYEISNFCKPGFHSRHNSAYWQGVPYLGCGASAHSFDGTSRRWNIASLDRYITGIEQRHPYYETEQLDLSTRYNEYIMTGLRTKPGIRTAEIEARFGTSLRSYCQKQAAPYIESGKLSFTGGQLSLTREGIFVSDGIISDLMFVE